VIPRPSADYFVVGQRQKVMLIKGIYFFLNLDYFCLDLENESKPTKKQIFFCAKYRILRSLPNIRLPNIWQAIIQPNVRPTGLSVVHLFPDS
jgi:hypothetical protein